MLPTSNDAKKEKLKDVLLGLHWAATTGNVGLIKFALDHGVPIDSAVNGFVPLQLACISDNNIAAVQYLIDRGADVNIQKWSKKHSVDKTQAVPGATGSTALHVACANGCIKIVDLLIRNNARIDVKDKYGSTPLDVAQAKHEAEIVKLLKAVREQQRHYKYCSMPYSNDNDENENSRARKSTDSVAMTHKRASSDKQPRIRRPSLPSIFERHNHFLPQNIPSFISMTPSSTSLTTATNASSNLESSSAASRRSFSAHRPLTDEMHTHSCPVTPRTSFDYFNNSKRSQNRSIPYKDRSPRSSEDSSAINYSTSPAQGSILNPDYATAVVTADGQPDWYAYGVVNSYYDDNYLLSLERRAYNLASNEEGGLERHSQDSSRRPAVYDDITSPAYRRRSTASSGDDQQIDPHINTRRSDSSDSGNKLRTTALKNAMAVNNGTSVNLTADSITPTFEYEEEGYDGEDDDEEEEEEEEEEEVDDNEGAYSNEPLPRPSVVLDSGPEADLVRYRFLHQDQQADAIRTSQERGHIADHPHHVEGKKSWFSGLGKEVGRHSLDSHSRKSLDFRPSFENFTQFAKRGVPNILSQDDDSSDDNERLHQQQQQQRNGFFSRWTPAWSKK